MRHDYEHKHDMNMNAREYEIAIVGGGLAGASLAAALAPSGIKLAVIESRAADDPAHASFDERSVALTYDARQLYARINVWEQVAHAAEPIREIHISDRGHFGMTHLRACDAGVAALGYVMPARALGLALHARMEKCAEVFCPATLQDAQFCEDGYSLNILQHDETINIRAGLVVLADGGRSGLAAQFGIKTTAAKTYPQRALLSIVATDRDHHGRAYERFTREGPLALLPYSARRYAVVWTGEAAQVERRLALSDDEFRDELQTAFGGRAGNFTAPGARRAYPLRRGRAHPLGRRALSLGDAAHMVHPVAGQGFNLGLRDVAALVETLNAHARCINSDGVARDFGARTVLENYAAARRHETARVSAFTDGLLRVFGSRNRALGMLRNLALAGIEFCPPAKRMLLWRTMGMAAARARMR